MELNQELVVKLLSRKKKNYKIKELKNYQELVFKLHKVGLSLKDICIYLKREHNIKVSPSTLKTAFPILGKRLEQFKKIVKNMTDEELKKAFGIIHNELLERNILNERENDS